MQLKLYIYFNLGSEDHPRLTIIEVGKKDNFINYIKNLTLRKQLSVRRSVCVFVSSSITMY